MARNPLKVNIHPVTLPHIPGPVAGVPREAFAKATRLGAIGMPKLPTRFASRTVDRKGPVIATSKSSATLPPKSSMSQSMLMSGVMSLVPPLPPKKGADPLRLANVTPKRSNMTLPPKSSGKTPPPTPTRPNETKLIRSLKPGRSLDEEELRMDPPRIQDTPRKHSLDIRAKPVLKPNNSRTLDHPTDPRRPPSLYLSQSVRTSDWQTLEDVPENLDVTELSVDGVARCLELLDLYDFVPFFRRMMVDGRMLLELDRSTLVDDFGLTKLDAIRLTMFVNKWRPNLKRD